MPRIISPDPVRAPGGIINLPRPREVSAAPTGLPEFGAAVGDAGNQLLSIAVDQERKAERLRINTAAETRYAELRQRVDDAGTSVEGRALWKQEAPKVKQELARFAQERGMPEMAGELDFQAASHNNAVVSTLNRRAFGETADAGRAYAAATEEAIVAASSEPEAQRHRAALHRELEALAANNPMFSAADADALYRNTVSNAAVRRAQGAIASAADDPAALRGVAASLREGTFADLPADSQAILAQSADDAAERAELHRLAMLDTIEARQERLARRQREANETTWAAQLARGEATVEDLTAALERRDIDVAFYDRSLRFMQADAAGVDDPEMALILRAGAYDGSVTGIDVMSAPLTQQTKEELLNIIGTRGTESVLHRADTKRARDFLVDSITGPRGPLGQLLDPNDAPREAAAVREFDERVLAGEDRWSVTDQLIPQFRVTPATAAEIGKPMFLVGTLANPDVPATAQALVDAFFAGKITEADLVRERDRLLRLAEAARDARTRSQAAAAAATERRR